jgi:hypothetical protein
MRKLPQWFLNLTYSENRQYVLSKSSAENNNEINRIKERITLLNTSFPVINEKREKYIEEYNEALSSKDVVKAIFLKNALGLPYDDESSEINVPTGDNGSTKPAKAIRQLVQRKGIL